MTIELKLSSVRRMTENKREKADRSRDEEYEELLDLLGVDAQTENFDRILMKLWFNKEYPNTQGWGLRKESRLKTNAKN